MSHILSSINRHKDDFRKALDELTPARRKALEDAFGAMQKTEEAVQPPMRHMHFGGSYDFDEKGKSVYLEGDFSKDDLFRIALTLI